MSQWLDPTAHYPSVHEGHIIYFQMPVFNGNKYVSFMYHGKN